MQGVSEQSKLARLLSRKSLWRAVWLTVLLLHIPATYRVFSLAFVDESRWTGALLIAATNLVFILEIIFGWSLKVLTDRRRIVVFLVIVALLHVGVIDHALPGVSMTDFSAWLAITVGGAAMLKRWLPVLRRIAADWQRIVFQIDLLRRRLDYDFVTVNRRPAFVSRFLVSARPHRAPPL